MTIEHWGGTKLYSGFGARPRPWVARADGIALAAGAGRVAPQKQMNEGFLDAGAGRVALQDSPRVRGA